VLRPPATFFVPAKNDVEFSRKGECPSPHRRLLWEIRQDSRRRYELATV
jgi:hypothetical protein